MLEATYADQDEVGILNKCKVDVIAKREKLSGLARVGISTGGKTLPESKATTRYSETESCEVLLIRKRSFDEADTILTLLNSETIRLPRYCKSKGLKQWRSLAAELQQNVVLVPEYLAPSTTVIQIQWIKDFVYLGDGDESPFRVAIVHNNGSISGLDHGNALKGYELSYTPELGYTARKVCKEDSSTDQW